MPLQEIASQLENDLAYQLSVEQNDAYNMTLVLRAYQLPYTMGDATALIEYARGQM